MKKIVLLVFVLCIYFPQLVFANSFGQVLKDFKPGQVIPETTYFKLESYTKNNDKFYKGHFGKLDINLQTQMDEHNNDVIYLCSVSSRDKNPNEWLSDIGSYYGAPTKKKSDGTAVIYESYNKQYCWSLRIDRDKSIIFGVWRNPQDTIIHD